MCERCKTRPKSRNSRFCWGCTGKVLSDMERDKYISTPDEQKRRLAELGENIRTSKLQRGRSGKSPP